MKSQSIYSQPVPDFGALLESLKENGRRIDELVERGEREREKERQEREKERQEREAKWEKDRAEFKERMDKISADTNRSIKEMRDVFTSQYGRVVEALCKPAALALFRKEGLGIDRIYEGIHKAKDNGQDVMEIDVALCDTTVAVIVEVKSRCGRREIDYFMDQMKHCKEWYSEFADKELRVAVAAIKYDDGVEKYALGRGLYVLKLTGEETFTMSAPKKPEVF